MRKRLVVAAFCILAVPPLFGSSQNNKLTSAAPFATVALAGRTIAGSWCACGTPDCICDPGELPASSRSAPSNTSFGGKRVKGSAPDVDVASGVFALALAFLLLMRMR